MIAKKCPRCGSTNIEVTIARSGANPDSYYCHNCHKTFALYENGAEADDES